MASLSAGAVTAGAHSLSDNNPLDSNHHAKTDATQVSKIADRMRNALAGRNAPAHRVAFDFGENGQILVDGGRGTVDLVEPGKPVNNVAATLTVSTANFIKLAKGELDPMKALLRRKLKIDGDVGLVLSMAAKLREDHRT